MCVRPCPCYLTGGDTHIICIACWGEEHTQSAFENTGCEHCDMLTDAPIPPGVFSRTLRLAFPRALVPLLPRHSEGWGSQNGSVSEDRDGHRLISAFTWRVQCFVSGLGSTRCGFIRPDRSTYTAAIWFWGIKCCQCKRYWGFATSVSCLWGFDVRAVEKLCNDWPTEREGVRSRGNLTNAFFLLVHNLNAGDYHFSWSPHRGVEIMGETVFL